MDNEYMEYSTFTILDKDGNEVEMAVVDEFEVDHKKYVAASQVIGDEISDEGVYIYRAKVENDELICEKITDEKEYSDVIDAYMELE